MIVEHTEALYTIPGRSGLRATTGRYSSLLTPAATPRRPARSPDRKATALQQLHFMKLLWRQTISCQRSRPDRPLITAAHALWGSLISRWLARGFVPVVKFAGCSSIARTDDANTFRTSIVNDVKHDSRAARSSNARLHAFQPFPLAAAGGPKPFEAVAPKLPTCRSCRNTGFPRQGS